MIDQFIGKTVADKYRIESVWREGDLGITYRATHVSIERPVTIKILAPQLAIDEGSVRRFSAEARTASRISHPNILNVTDSGADTDGTIYITFENAEGETLKEALDREGMFTAERATSVVRQTAAALSAAHAGSVIHGALTSDNILLARAADSAETVKVSSFGSVQADDWDTLDGAFARSVEYLAPEQCSGASAADERSDVYALGVIFYEMLAGEMPFAGVRPTEIMSKHMEEMPPPLSAFRQDLPAEIEPIVLRAMAKNPEMRYQSAREFSDDLDRVAFDPAAPKTLGAASVATANNNIWKTAFVVLAGISLLAIGLIYATSVKQTDPTTRLQTDANGQPVQPINPATGSDEQNLSNMSSMPAEIIGNSSTMPVPPGTVPGGDGYNPWANGVQPPPGAPTYVAPGGQVITIDPNNPSQFMPNEGGVILVPVPANANINANVKPAPTPKTSPANANVAPTPAPKPTADGTPQASPQTTPSAKPPAAPRTEKTPATPTEKPKPTPPAASEKRGQSGTEQVSGK